ncbi:hypothetical protein MIN45_P2154 [Methylomarinovum tepidoasis]|uniref:Tetratricopeptide repeat protein n=1 Tax=Methylomarinovum tepidoasis TaxID=2840183 RepID=A0AAU9CK19_9GAMM|nr:tetratricopeptide repeat protein [Methylomarinovum sp. IN45]BCX89781.1 hypothetical protein MIN45_P2154 [Methylomarinovum sp. IN45]
MCRRLLPFLLALSLTTAVQAAQVSPQTFRTLEKVGKLLDQRHYDQAVGLLRQRLEKTGAKAEKALLLRALGAAYAAKGDYRQAVRYLQQALDSGALPQPQAREALRTLGQLYLALDQPRQAAALLERWLKTQPEIHAEDHLLLAQVYTRLERYRAALAHLNQAIAKTGRPKDAWLQLRIGINYQLKRYHAAIADLKTLIRRHPEQEKYWRQLAGLYNLAGKRFNAAAVAELEHFLGLRDQEPEILNLVNLLRLVHVPYLAGERLQQALKARQVKSSYRNWRLLADTWIEAREFQRAVTALQRAARLSGSGQPWLRLAQLHLEREAWQDAIDALKTALKKGGLRDPGQAWLLLGSAYFETGRGEAARKAFARARQFPSTRKAATQWLKYLQQTS